MKELDRSVARLVAEYWEVKADQAVLKRREAALRAQFAVALGRARSGSVEGKEALRWVEVERDLIDVAAVRERYPDVAEACRKVTTVKTLRVLS